MQFTLLIPELIWPEAGDGVLEAIACPALQTLLARSRLTRRPAQSFEATLADLFAPPGALANPPYAALRLHGERPDAGLPAVGVASWLCCDPIHLHFHQQQLIVADSGGFEISLEEALELAGELNRELPELGRFHVASAGRWYLQLAERTLADGFATLPLSLVAGRRIAQLLPEVPASRTLRSRLNEAQMLLHAHPINQRREALGQMPINSLWLWGAGALPEYAAGAADGAAPGAFDGVSSTTFDGVSSASFDGVSSAIFDGVWSATPLPRGLARAAGVLAHPLPSDAHTLLEHVAADTHHLVVLPELLAPVQYERGDAYRDALADLDARWIAPLRAALGRGTIQRLRVAAPTVYATLSWESTRREQWKLWRRAAPLAALARALTQTSKTGS